MSRHAIADATESFKRAVENTQDGDVGNAAHYAMLGVSQLADSFDTEEERIEFLNSLDWRSISA